MKLATCNDGSRDGQLAVVSRDLAQAHFASGIAGRLQQVLDDWNFLSPQLHDLYVTLNQGKARHAFAFEPGRCMAPLPRAFRCVGGPGSAGHRSRLQLDDADAVDPPLFERGGDDLLGPQDAVSFGQGRSDIDFGAGLAVVTGDVAMAASAEQGLDSVRLLLLVNDWLLHDLAAAEQARGGHGVQGRPATAFGPVAVTPDELGAAWRGGRLHLALRVTLNDRAFGSCDAAAGMPTHFGALIAGLARTRRLRAGSIVVGGTVFGADPAQGHCCIADRRATETAARGAPSSAYLMAGDRLRIEVIGDDGQSVFGAIEQRVGAAAAADDAGGLL